MPRRCSSSVRHRAATLLAAPLLVALPLALFVPRWAAARSIPTAPTDYVLDEAGWLADDQRAALARRLQGFEQQTSNQLVVAIFRTLDGADLAEFNNRVANAWGIGQADKHNGMLLSVYAQERKIAIEVGYGLEGRVTDLVSDLVIREQMGPAFAHGRYAEGIMAGVESLIAASRGEFQGTGRTVADRHRGGRDQTLIWIVIVAVLLLGGAGRRRRAFGPTVLGPWMGPYGGGPGGRGGFGSGSGLGGGGFRIPGSGGTFRGGGGHFGGGGARGGW